MGIESIIAKRILKGENNRISRPIINITSGAITVGIALMLLSLVVLEGFQDKIRDKVVGFGSHLTILPAGNNYSKESTRVLAHQEFYGELLSHPQVKHVQKFAVKPGILETSDNIHGVLIKGIAEDFDWSFFSDKLVQGDTLELKSIDTRREMLVSEYIAKRLKLSLGDKITVYFVQNDSDIKPRKFNVIGTYETGLEEFDQKYVFVDLRHIQRISKWGLEAQIRIRETCFENRVTVEGLAFGGDGRHHYHWSLDSLEGSGPHDIPLDSSPLQLIIEDQLGTIPDTANIVFSSKNEVLPCDSIDYELTTTGGSYNNYCGGFEVLLTDYEALGEMDHTIFKMVPMSFQTQMITQQYPEIFNWLDMLDVNVYIIIALMIFIALINMTSALLIIILEKTRMIGLLKAFGSKNASVVRIFLLTSLRLIGRGIVWGNVLGLGIALLQRSTGFIQLNPENYFVDAVPVSISWDTVLWLNAGTIGICMLFLVIPALYVTSISPVKAISME